MAGLMSAAEILRMRKAATAATAGTSSGASGRPPKPTSAPSTPTSVVQDLEVVPEKQKKKKRKVSPAKSPVRVGRRGRPGPNLFSEDLDVNGILDTFVTAEDRRHLESLDTSDLTTCSVRSLVQTAATAAHLGSRVLGLQEELGEAKGAADKLREELAAQVEQVEELKKTQDAQKASEAKIRQKLKLSEEKKKGLEQEKQDWGKEKQSLQDSLNELRGQFDKLLVSAATSLEEIFANAKAQAEVLAPDADFSGMAIDGHVEGGMIVRPEAQPAEADPSSEVPAQAVEEEVQVQEEPTPEGGDP